MKKITLNIGAITIGASLWYIFSQSRLDTLSLEVPLCFYGTEKISKLEAPEKIRITLSGKRSDLETLDIEHLAAHVDASRLNQKSSKLSLAAHHLFLPATIKLVHYSPAPIEVHVGLEGNQL
jgi:hypothetical protein